MRHANKYNAKKVVIDGITFDSIAEGDCYMHLKLLERAQEVRDIECHQKTPLIAGITHKTDFKYFDVKRNQTVYGEYKGYEGQRWRDIHKLWIHCGPGILRVYKGRGNRIYCEKEIIPDHMK